MSKANNSTSLGLNHNSDYKRWLKDLKQKVQQTQIKAAIQVNTTLLAFYWELGADIVKRQSTANWGDGFLKQLSKDLMKAFPDIKGFSERNLKYIRQWFLFYSRDQAIGQQAVAQLAQVPWGHNLQIIPTHTADIPEHTAIIPVHTAIIPAHTAVIPAHTAVIPAHSAVIPAKAGIYPTHKRETGGLKRSSFTMDSRLRGNDVVRASEYQLTQSLPENLQSQLTSVEEIEQELGGKL